MKFRIVTKTDHWVTNNRPQRKIFGLWVGLYIFDAKYRYGYPTLEGAKEAINKYIEVLGTKNTVLEKE